MWASTGTRRSARAAMPPSDEAIGAALRALAARRGSARSFCPSEAARAVTPQWRALMPDVRRVAGGLCDAGVLEAVQRGAPVDPRTARGPIRLRAPG